MEARFTEKLWEPVQGNHPLLEWSKGTGAVLAAPAQGDIPSGSQGAAERNSVRAGREKERETETETEITFSHCLCQPSLTPPQKDPAALQRGSGKSTSSFYDKILLWPGIY